MQVNNNSKFIEYNLTPTEQVHGCILNYLQRGVIQNQRLELTEQLIQLKPDTMDAVGTTEYWQRKAYLQGQLDIYTHLLDKSEAAEQEINTAQDQSATL